MKRRQSSSGAAFERVRLILLGGVTGYVGYKALNRYRVERLVSRLTVRQVIEKLTAGEDPMIIDLRPHADRQEWAGIPGSLPMTFEELAAGQHDLPRAEAARGLRPRPQE